MSAVARRSLLIAFTLLACGILTYELWPSDEAHISSLLGELCTQLNQTRDEPSLSRLRLFLRGALRPEVEVHVPELGQDLLGVEAVLQRAEDLSSPPPLSFAWSSVAIHPSGKLARVDADLVVTVRGSGEQHRDLRPTHVRLVKIGQAWQIEAVDVAPVPSAEPEARP